MQLSFPPVGPAHLVGVPADADLAQAGDGDDAAVAAHAAGHVLQGLVDGDVRRYFSLSLAHFLAREARGDKKITCSKNERQ